MPLRLVLCLSVCVNVLLLAWSIANDWRPRAASQPSLSSNSGVPANASANSTTTSPLRGLSSWTAAPRWADIQSDDLAQYVANLRSAGFPEPIVQNVIVTELDRLYALRLPRHSRKGFWRSGPEEDAEQAEYRRVERELDAEKRARIKQLLGVEWYETSTATREDGTWLLTLNSQMSIDQLERLSRLWAKIDGEARDLQPQDHFRTTELENLRHRAYSEAVEELRSALGPAEFEELELRAMASDVMDVWGPERLFGCVMTGQELREFLRIRRDADLPLGDLFDISPPPAGEELSRSIDERIRALLGEERYQGYERAKDPQFRWIRGALREDPSMESTWAVYDIYAGVKASAAAAFDEPGTPPDQLQAYLQELRGWAENQVERALGPDKFPAYAKSSDNLKWLDELTVQLVNSK